MNNLRDRSFEIIQPEKQTNKHKTEEEKKKKSEESQRDLYDTIKWTNIYIMGFQKKREKEQKAHLKK